MDMFRNPKLSAAVYASQKTPRAPSDIVLEISSSMALGDHPGGFAGACWAFTNAESVRLYRDNDFIAEFSRTGTAGLQHCPTPRWRSRTLWALCWKNTRVWTAPWPNRLLLC